jgi:hypothetical protein
MRFLVCPNIALRAKAAAPCRHQIQSPHGRYPDPTGGGKISGKQSLFLQLPPTNRPWWAWRLHRCVFLA